jgi:hypothetical protein
MRSATATEMRLHPGAGGAPALAARARSNARLLPPPRGAAPRRAAFVRAAAALPRIATGAGGGAGGSGGSGGGGQGGGGGSWMPDEDDLVAFLAAAQLRLEPALAAAEAALLALWAAQRRWVATAWACAAAWALLALGAASALANAWAVPAANARLPALEAGASRALGRAVRLGRVRWVSPIGALGLGPLVALGPIAVGAGPVEKSSATLERVRLRLDVGASLARARLVLTLAASGAEVDLRQADNFSWFGFPDDTAPSSRDFAPGLPKAPGAAPPPPPRPRRRNRRRPPGGDAGDGGEGGEAGGAAAAGPAPPEAGAPPAPAPQAAQRVADAAAAGASFLERIAEELLAWQPDAPPGGSSDEDAAPALLLAGGGAAAAHAAGRREAAALFRQTGGRPGADGAGAAAEPAPRRGFGFFRGAGGATRGPAQAAATADEAADEAAAEAAKRHCEQAAAINAIQGVAGALKRSAGAAPVPLSPPPADSPSAAPIASSSSSSSSDDEAALPAREGAAAAAAEPAAAPLPPVEPPAVADAAPSAAPAESLLAPLVAFSRKLQSLLPGCAAPSAPTAEAAPPNEAEPPRAAADDAPPPEPALVADALAPEPAPPPRPVAGGAAAINAIPGRRLVLRPAAAAAAAEPRAPAPAASSSEPEEEGGAAAAAPPAGDGARSRGINALAPLAARLAAAPSDRFAASVADPAALRKQRLGSKALQAARRWEPAQRPAPAELRPPPAARPDAATPPAAAAAAPAAAAERVAEPAAAPPVPGAAAAAGAASAAGKPGRLRLPRPGDDPPAPPGPAYTPAPPGALAALRARDRSPFALARRAARAAGALAARALVLGALELRGATLRAHVAGEPIPRVFEDVRAVMRLGRSYDSLAVEIAAKPRARHPASSKVTMLNPRANRHLRAVTGAAAAARRAAGLPPADALALPRGAAYAADQPADADGGDLRIRIAASGLLDGGARAPGGAPRAFLDREALPLLEIAVAGRRLHAPLVERLVELPMDVDAGRADGELVITSSDAASWRFPEFRGRVAVRGARFHFWDATDEIEGDLDLLFEKDRLYIHNAVGRFGAVPLALSGDLDLDPERGEYRLSATVPGVEVNALRATLGVRPTPFPVAGAVRGTLHVSGPLEQPVFSGRVVAIAPTAALLADAEPSAALAALRGAPGAAGAYDRVPFAAAGALYELDTATETLTLHALHAAPVGGGALRGHGRMRVSPAAEAAADAVNIKVFGEGLDVEALARRYLPPAAAPLPAGAAPGAAALRATMRGSHLAPVIDVEYELPNVAAVGRARLTREATHATLRSPHLDAAATAHLRPPPLAAVRAAVTQAAATALARPDVAGADLELSLRGLDAAPLAADSAALRRLAASSGEPLRLRLNGRARVSGAVERAAAEESADGSSAAGAAPWVFAGNLDLEDLRLNQLRLFRKVGGPLRLSERGASVHARGPRPDEALDLELSLPLLGGGDSNAAAAAAGSDGTASASGSHLSLRCGQLVASADVDAGGAALDARLANVRLDELELASLRGELQEVSCSLNFAAATGRGRLAVLAPRYSGLAGESLAGGFRWERDVVRLEKLALVQRASRYELQGEYVVPPSTPLPTSAADLARPRVVAAAAVSAGAAAGAAAGGGAAAPSGRWRLRVDVPSADLEEILPAVRIARAAASRAPADYERAKAAFLGAVSGLALSAGALGEQVARAAEQVAGGLGAVVAEGSGGSGGASGAAAPPAAADGPADGGGLRLPALQDARGQWGGSVQAFGGGGGATSVEFDVRGAGWRWGAAALDAAAAAGAYHSEEGLALQELVLRAGDAKLLVRGTLGGAGAQDATVLLTDFPVARLRPLFRAAPALRRAAPAAAGAPPGPAPSPAALGALAGALRRAGAGLQDAGGGAAAAGAGPDADSPVNGLLYVSGALGGSWARPTGEVAVRLYDGAIGATRLAAATASARLAEGGALSFNVDVVPAGGHRRAGHVRAAGTLPLRAPLGAGLDPEAPLDVRLSVRDAGVAVLAAVAAPELRWGGGEAALTLRAAGPAGRPAVAGAATLARATLEHPLLKYPLVVAAAEVRAADGLLEVVALDARCGRRGHVRARGVLPLYRGGAAPRGAAAALAHVQQRLTLDVAGLELRARGAFSGQLDALLTLRDSVEAPTVGGSVRLSRGTIFLVPQGGGGGGGSGGPGGAGGDLAAGAPPPPGPSVARVFDLLTRSGAAPGLAARLEDAARRREAAAAPGGGAAATAAAPGAPRAGAASPPAPAAAPLPAAGAAAVAADALAVQLGPDLRAVYPLFANVGVAGELVLSGPLTRGGVAIAGALRLPGGEVNLVATQLELDRAHANTITFGGDGSAGGAGGAGGAEGGANGGAAAPALDPLVDLALVSGDLRVAVRGRASEWADRLVMHSTAGGGAAGGGPAAGEALDAAEAAALLEGRLRAALLAEDGQLALSRLAGTTVSTLLPKLETAGQVGGARWRLVSAPTIPGLLDPFLADPAGLLGSIAVGTEMEVQFGRRLQAAMSRKLQESDVTTQWTLNYVLSRGLGLRFNISSAPPYQRTLTLSFSS